MAAIDSFRHHRRREDSLLSRTNRHHNRGLRIDYCVVSSSLCQEHSSYSQLERSFICDDEDAFTFFRSCTDRGYFPSSMKAAFENIIYTICTVHFTFRSVFVLIKSAPRSRFMVKSLIWLTLLFLVVEERIIIKHAGSCAEDP